MKINFAPSEKSLKKDIAVVRLTEEKETAVVERADGHKELRLGAGKTIEHNRRKLITVARHAVILAREQKIKKIAITLKDFSTVEFWRLAYQYGGAVHGEGSKGNLSNLPDFEALGTLLAENWEMANYEFRSFKTRPSSGWNDVQEIFIIGKEDAPLKRGIKRGQIVGKEINACRELSNTPGGIMTPRILAERAREATLGTDVNVLVLGKRDMEELGMGAVLGVAQGSSEEPQFIILEYRGGEKDEAPVVLAGKGVTFDTGGLNLKPEQGIYEMHMDMSGGAAVIHTVALVAKLGITKNVVALVPAVENMPSGSSYHPGDILKSLSGKTIEILNTDAEGRVILADALTYAERYKPRLVVDVATLTGASLVALGTVASAIMTPDSALQEKLRQWGEETGEYVWPFPLWSEYDELVKGRFGDIPNIPAEGNSRYAGVIGGGMFLFQFAKKYPWVHIDMAPRMTSTTGDHLAKGAAGSPIRLLLRVIENH